MKITKTKLKQLIIEELVKLKEVRELPGLGDRWSGYEDEGGDPPMDDPHAPGQYSGEHAAADAAEDFHDHVLHDTLKNWLGENALGVDMRAVELELARILQIEV